jgi:hypothetical protein
MGFGRNAMPQLPGWDDELQRPRAIVFSCKKRIFADVFLRWLIYEVD